MLPAHVIQKKAGWNEYERKRSLSTTVYSLNSGKRVFFYHHLIHLICTWWKKNVNSTQNSACHKCAVGTFGPKEQSGIMYIMIHPLMVAWDWHVLCWEPACGNGGKCSLEFRPRESELFWWINMSSWQIYLLMLFKFSFLNCKMGIKECFYHTVDVRIR